MKPFYQICRLLAVLLPTASAMAQTPELSADSPIAYSEETGLLIATGNAVYKDENTTVTADEIRYNRDQDRIEAEGNVVVTRKGIRLLARTVNYNARDKTFSATGFRAGYPPLFIEGESFSGDLDQLEFSNVDLYFREPVSSAPKLSLRSGQWINEEAVRGKGVSLDAFGGLGIPLPGFSYVFGQPTVDVTASLGYRENLGVYGQSRWLYPFTGSLSLGGNLDFYTERGILVGPALDYTGNAGRTRAWLDSGWIHDHSFEERGRDVLGERIDQDRGFLNFGYAARNAGSLQFQTRGTYLADSEVLRDFRTDFYTDLYHPDHYMDFTWQDSSFLLNVFSRVQILDYYQMVERLPEVRAEWLPTELGDTRIFLQASAAATRYRVQQLAPGNVRIPFPDNPLGLGSIPPLPGSFPADLRTSDFYQRLDGSATLTRPFNAANGIQMVLRAGGRWTHYDKEGDDTYRADERWMGELGIDLSQTLARTYPVDLPRFNIARLRHQSRTSLKYRWHPGAEDAPDAPLFDAYAYRARAPALDMADLWHIDSLREWSVARFGWENAIHIADKDADYREVLGLNLYQDLLFSEDPGEDQWEALYAEVDFTPFPWFRMQLMQKFNTEGFNTEASFLRASLRSADLWQVSLQAEYLENAIEQYKINSWYRLNENIGLIGDWQFDSRLNAWTVQRYGVSRRFGNVWQLELYITLTDEDERRDDFSVGLRLKWLSF